MRRITRARAFPANPLHTNRKFPTIAPSFDLELMELAAGQRDAGSHGRHVGRHAIGFDGSVGAAICFADGPFLLSIPIHWSVVACSLLMV